MELFLNAETYGAVLLLCFLEIVLGIDNIIFISIVSNKLPAELRQRARNIGLSIALLTRIAFLFGITWIIGFKEPLFSIPPNLLFSNMIAFSGRDLILGAGGLFLIAKSVQEIHHKTDNTNTQNTSPERKYQSTLLGTIVQIILIDIVFSFDSILTAVGTADHVIIMIASVIIAIVVMMLCSGKISRFIHAHPSIDVLAIGFILLIGFVLFLEALHYTIPKSFIYFALTFSLAIELVNIRARKRKDRHTAVRETKSLAGG